MSALAKNYNRRKIAFKRGDGSFLYATNGKKYLDFCSGIAVTALGHSHPKLIKTIIGVRKNWIRKDRKTSQGILDRIQTRIEEKRTARGAKGASLGEHFTSILK